MNREMLYKLSHLDEINSIAELLEILVSFSFEGPAAELDAQRSFTVEIVNRIVCLASAEACAMVLAKLAAHGIVHQ